MAKRKSAKQVTKERALRESQALENINMKILEGVSSTGPATTTSSQLDKDFLNANSKNQVYEVNRKIDQTEQSAKKIVKEKTRFEDGMTVNDINKKIQQAKEFVGPHGPTIAQGKHDIGPAQPVPQRSKVMAPDDYKAAANNAIKKTLSKSDDSLKALKSFGKKAGMIGMGAAMIGTVVTNMSRNKGQQSNANLYGQR